MAYPVTQLLSNQGYPKMYKTLDIDKYNRSCILLWVSNRYPVFPLPDYLRYPKI